MVSNVLSNEDMHIVDRLSVISDYRQVLLLFCAVPSVVNFKSLSLSPIRLSNVLPKFLEIFLGYSELQIHFIARALKIPPIV